MGSEGLLWNISAMGIKIANTFPSISIDSYWNCILLTSIRNGLQASLCTLCSFAAGTQSTNATHCLPSLQPPNRSESNNLVATNRAEPAGRQAEERGAGEGGAGPAVRAGPHWRAV